MSESIIGWMNSAHVFIPSAELAKAFIVFLIFSSIGWICEVCYVGIFFEHKFVNRGFLFGPLCPVYGIGGILILLTPEKLQNPVRRLFITGIVLCSVVEYAASFMLEQIFHLKLWDYSDRILKLRGHTINNPDARIKWAESRHNASETFVKRFPTLTGGVYKDSLTLIKKHLENRLTENIGKK